MAARQSLVAGAIVTTLGAVALSGWAFDVTAAKSVMDGWRVMVPATAVSFALIGVALILGSESKYALARASGALALIVPFVTFIEYLSGTRSGVESWFGTSFDPASAVAGRLSPLSSVCLCVVAAAAVSATTTGARALAFARVASSSTLLAAWLAGVAVAFDAGRLADAPRFPGMAVATIALMAIASWGVLTLTFTHDSMPAPSPRTAGLVTIAFLVPSMLGWIREMTNEQLPPQVLTALLVFALTGSIATMVWQYAARMTTLRHERERALVELERRVEERTGELAARNAALKESDELLRQADRRKDEFLATLAHELRNPLAPIRNAVALLRSDRASGQDRDAAREMIERQVSLMARLIDDLLDVSRITVDKLPLRSSRVMLGDVLTLAVATARPHVDGARHRLLVSIPAEPIAVIADEARLSQVFANLLHNACKYTEPGGEILLAVSQPNDTEVAVSVRDNGIGIPPDFLPRLFEKFSQVDAAVDRSQGGLGIGLSLVRAIVTLHGGRVEARSAGPGRGSEFIVYLPTARPSVDAPAAGTPPGIAEVVTRRVLVADDNEDSAESMALLLRALGHIVETAHDGIEACDRADGFQPEVLLLDLGMPKLNGYEVCRHVRGTTWGQSVLIVAQTGWGQAEERQRTLEAGFDAHLTKPVDPDRIQELLVRHRTGEQEIKS